MVQTSALFRTRESAQQDCGWQAGILGVARAAPLLSTSLLLAPRAPYQSTVHNLPQSMMGMKLRSKIFTVWIFWCAVLFASFLVSVVTSHELGRGGEQPVCNNNSDDDEYCEAAKVFEPTCTLYMAPSAIPGAGLGVYTAVDVPHGTTVGAAGAADGDNYSYEDPFIAIQDVYKTLPYAGQQLFRSWLAYIWPAKPDTFYHKRNEGSYPTIPSSFYLQNEGLNGAEGLIFRDDVGGKKKRLSVFAPGLASLVNSEPLLVNLEQAPRPKNSSAGSNSESSSEAAAAFAPPHHKVAFSSIRDIPAGSELYLDYGRRWHDRHDDMVDREDDELEGLEDYMDRVEDWGADLPSEAEKRSRMEVSPKHRDSEEIKQKLAEIPDGTRQKKSTSTGTKKDLPASTKEAPVLADGEEEDDDDDDDAEDEEEDSENKLRPEPNYVSPRRLAESQRSMEWLEEHGMCLDNLVAGPSTVPDAGRGAFAARHLPAGSVLAPAPLLVLTRDNLNIFESDQRQSSYRNLLNFDRLMARELLLNYCYGDADSQVLLVPFAPMVNLINHGGGAAANAEIRWSAYMHDDDEDDDDDDDLRKYHPLDVLDHSGELMMEFVALRDIRPGEEIFIDYGAAWEQAWNAHTKQSSTQQSGETDGAFRHEIGLPSGVFPDAWKDASVVYELARAKEKLQPGEMVEMTFAHNDEPIAKDVAYRVGLPSGFSDSMRAFSDRMGITSLYGKLLYNDILGDEEWFVFETPGEEWMAHRYKSTDWAVNIHYVQPWNETARLSMLAAMGEAGFDVALESIGKEFGLDNLTCFAQSFMGVSEADNSFTHTDVYATGEKGFNIIFPIYVVEGSKPELDIIGDDANIELAVKYNYDEAIVMADWGYHKTSAMDYSDSGEMRIVFGTYCAQIDDDNALMVKYIYDEEGPAPFCDQFEPGKEAHWCRDRKCSLKQ